VEVDPIGPRLERAGAEPGHVEQILDEAVQPLGLAICRGFVEAMGGTIVAANRTDRKGAVFTIELPLSAEATRSKVLGEAA
jgi:signal transduction histidine kinase